MTESKGWIAVDLDGTLAVYDTWRGVEHIGAPIAPMVERVKQWLIQGRDVRIFTARVYGVENPDNRILDIIARWCELHIGVRLPVTCTKDYDMIVLYDDRCVQVETNTGRLINGDV